MKKFNICISLILIITNIFVIGATKKDVCENCVKIEDCPAIAHLPTVKQKMWLKRFPCMILQKKHKHSPVFDLSTDTERAHICCPNSNVLKSIHDYENMLLSNSYKYQQMRKKRQNPFFNNGDGLANSGAQCTEQTSLLPDPSTGCCGRHMSDSTSITDLQSILNIFAPVNQAFRRRRSAESMSDDTELDDRISGGKATELDEFPWTVLLKMTYTFGDKSASFNCGGSLISSKYVLTASHCLNEDGGTLVDIEITLAEYDKSKFPRDCKSGLGEMNCIDNILMHAKNVILHPEYDEDTLLNDIALIELDGYAPYTRYIRPICIPPINVDDPVYSNLPLAVAGWGRIGQYLTDIKQSTVVHLVPNDECEQAYPGLSNTQLCAAGRTGEDTCKGDSGGPLMLLYRNNYYVVGVVSGKRADSPCGTSVPTLFTNVFNYVPWIKSIIS